MPSYTYADLVQFEPLESVIQLKDADNKAEARQLVRTYVISNDMADKLASLVLPQLQYNQPVDNKGLFIVGNYGTGKSHLMSVLSALAEHADLLDELQNDKVRSRAKDIAGQFKVIRTEVGTVRRSLYEVLADDLSNKLAAMGVSFSFPSNTTLINHKQALSQMMQAFEEANEEVGLLIVVDELLEFLRARNEQELIIDLGFLREIGEFCKDSRLRFMAGIQETLFDNQRFSFVSESIRRVKDRFEQLLIARSDVKYVVEQRLLRKSPDQKNKIRAHLLQFAPFYGKMNERMDEFVNLFPVHPDYIDTLERVTAVEKRAILKSISQEIKKLLGQPLPTDKPGLLTYNRYWNTLQEDASFRSNPDYRAVIDCVAVLDSRVRMAFTRKAYTPMALEIIQGLAVHRLTTGDVNAPLGATAEELRDSLCLYHPAIADMGSGDPASDLLSQVEVVLREILKTVNGQFISHNPNNRQYYLDLKKTEDYDALIEKKAESLDDRYRDRYYFEALKLVMECHDLTDVLTGYKIWQYELEWRERKATRQGYLFFGAPNERSTAQPPRDFYLYFLPYFAPAPSAESEKNDEVYFRLTSIEPVFKENLDKYAAALELSLSASGSARRTYEEKARQYQAMVVRWLQDNLTNIFRVGYEGRTRTMLDWIKSGKLNLARATARDTINAVAGVALAGCFEDLAPAYPAFPVLITSASRQNAAEQALRWLRGTKTAQGAATLDALKLLDGERLDLARSEAIYTRLILEKLAAKTSGQVLNRAELLQVEENQVEYLDPPNARLEVEWVVVLLAALVYNGDLTLAIAGKKFDAANLEALATTSFSDLANFKHVERPKDWNVAALRALCELLGIEPGKAQMLAQGQGQTEFVQTVQVQVNQLISRILRVQQKVSGGLPVWNARLLDNHKQAATHQKLNTFKQFLESLQAYNTPARFKNFSYEEAQKTANRAALSTLAEIESLDSLVSELLPLANYLSQAENFLTPAHPLLGIIKMTRTGTVMDLQVEERREAPNFRQQALRRLSEVKQDYIRAYAELHTRSRRGASEARRYNALKQDGRLKKLEMLRGIPLLPARQLEAFKAEVEKVRECSTLDEVKLETSPLCPDCRFQPVSELLPAPVAEIITRLDEQLDNLLKEWTDNLLDSLKAESVQRDLSLLKPEARQLIDDFYRSRRLPDELGYDFINAVKEVLAGLERLTVLPAQLLAALQKGGSPVTRRDFEDRFKRYMEDLFRNKNADRIRLVIETEEKE